MDDSTKFNLLWGFRISLFVFGVVAIFQLVPYFSELLQILGKLLILSDTSPEFKVILVCLSIWATCQVFNFIFNAFFKLYQLLDIKWGKK